MEALYLTTDPRSWVWNWVVKYLEFCGFWEHHALQHMYSAAKAYRGVIAIINKKIDRHRFLYTFHVHSMCQRYFYNFATPHLISSFNVFATCHKYVWVLKGVCHLRWFMYKESFISDSHEIFEKISNWVQLWTFRKNSLPHIIMETCQILLAWKQIINVCEFLFIYAHCTVIAKRASKLLKLIYVFISYLLCTHLTNLVHFFYGFITILALKCYLS